MQTKKWYFVIIQKGFSDGKQKKSLISNKLYNIFNKYILNC